MKKIFAMAAIGAAAIPISFVITLLLLPFWNWLEANAGIESVGHSGPAEWCFLAVFGVIVAAGCAMWFLRRPKQSMDGHKKRAATAPTA